MISHDGVVYFSDEELRCKGSGVVKLAPGFAEKLLELRLAFNEIMSVNSCCRSKIHNQNVDGSRGSLHVYDYPAHPTGGTCAIDIGTTDSRYRARLVKAALNLEWSVGINKSFVHLDRRLDYGVSDEPLIFLY